jgi:hypothetical protein
MMEEGNEQGPMIVNTETHITNSRHIWIIISIRHDHHTLKSRFMGVCEEGYLAAYSYAGLVQL